MPNWKKLIVSGSDASLNSLSVTNNVTAQSFTGSFSGSFTAPGATTQVVYNDGGTLAASSNFVFSGSRVGIGTASPNSILEISQATPIIRIESSDVNQFHGIEFRNGTNLDSFIKQLPSSGEFRISNGRSVGWGGHITFYTDTVERLRITPAGNVGIGTSSPGAKLDVTGNSKFVAAFSSYTTDGLFSATALPGIYVSTPGGARGTYIGYRDFGGGEYWGRIGVSGSVAWSLGIGNSTGTNFSIGLNNNTATDYFTVVSGSGNVGIGTTSPTATLEVNGNVKAVSFTGSFSGSVAAPGSTTQIVYNDNGVLAASSGLVYSGSNVGIGISSPTDKLHIVSSATGNQFGRITATDANASAAWVAQNDQADNVVYRVFGSTVSGTQMGAALGRSASLLANLGGSGVFLLGTFSNTDFILGTNNTENMRIKSGGNVGIGTTNPIYKLQVAGSTYVNGGTLFLDSGEYIRWGNSAQGIRGVNDTSLEFVAGSSTRMYVSASGDVGIGTTSPGLKLDVVSGASGNPVLRLQSTDTNGYSGAHLYSSAGTLTGHFGWANGSSSALSDKMYFGTIVNKPVVFTTNDTEKVRIAANGNVGIGTTSPGYKLDVVSSDSLIARFNGSAVVASSATEIDILGPQSNGELNVGVGGSTLSDSTNNIQNKGFITAGSGLDGLNLRSDQGYVQITAGGITPANEVARFTAGGNVGIGTSSPSQKLSVVGAVSASTYYGDGSNLTNIGSGSVAAAGSDGQIQYNNSGNFGGASRLYYNDSSNRVGIGISTPGYDLDVSGSARVTQRLRVGTINSGNGVVHESTDATINPTSAQTVWTISGTAGICAFMEYYVFNTNTNTSQRAGNIVLTWNQSGTPTITHTETSTPDIGSTSAITFTSTLTLGGDPQLIATNTSGDPWYMIMNYRYF